MDQTDWTVKNGKLWQIDLLPLDALVCT